MIERYLRGQLTPAIQAKANHLASISTFSAKLYGPKPGTETVKLKPDSIKK